MVKRFYLIITEYTTSGNYLPIMTSHIFKGLSLSYHDWRQREETDIWIFKQKREQKSILLFPDEAKGADQGIYRPSRQAHTHLLQNHPHSQIQ